MNKGFIVKLLDILKLADKEVYMRALIDQVKEEVKGSEYGEEYLKHLEEYLKDMRKFRESLLERLPYADGQAYYNDKDKIKRLGEDISELENLLYKEGP